MPRFGEAVGSEANKLAHRWWLLFMRGLAAIVVAAIAFAHPGDVLVTLVLVFAYYAVIVAVLAIIAVFAGIGGNHWWAVLLEGLVTVIFGTVVFSWPLTSTLAFVYLIAAWLVVAGVFQIAGGIQLRNFIGNEWLYITSGIVSIAFGMWLFRSGTQGMSSRDTWSRGIFYSSERCRPLRLSESARSTSRASPGALSLH